MAATPFLPLLNASGAESLRPKRLLLIWTPDGAPAFGRNNPIDWRPQGTQTDFTFSEIHEPLTPLRSKVVVPWGMNLTVGGAGEGHAFGMAGLWTASTLQEPSGDANFDGGNGNRTGWGSGPSVDQVVANAVGPGTPYCVPVQAPEQETPYRSIELGVHCRGPSSLNRMIYAGADAPVHPETNPRSAFNRFVGNMVSSEPDEGYLQRQTERRAMVDLLQRDVQQIRRRVGSEDQYKLDAHMEGLLALEQRIDRVSPTIESCTFGDVPPDGGDEAQTFDVDVRNMLDVAVAALSCDVTRVMSLQLSYAFSHVVHTWLGHNRGHHPMCHDGRDRRTELTEINRWYAQQIAYLMERMDAIDEGDGTLLDNTLIAWGRELGNTNHSRDRTPFILAGGGNLGLRGGRWLDVDGEPHVKVLVSIAQLMGVETNTFGNRMPDSGPLPGVV